MIVGDWGVIGLWRCAGRDLFWGRGGKVVGKLEPQLAKRNGR